MDDQDARDEEPTAGRKGWALCLSGGGFRAALFHLGALRRLNELGLLGRLDTISTVSGGSIIAAHLARRVAPWPPPGEVFSGWEQTVAAPFREFCSIDLRTPVALRSLRRPWSFVRKGFDPAYLQSAYAERLHAGLLSTLPERPEFVFCATEVCFGTLWRFERERIGSWRLRDIPTTSAADTVAAAVAASSCFPPLFAPMEPPGGSERIRGRGGDSAGFEQAKRNLRLVDGGVYDNLGFQPVIKRHRHILVSDGGAPFDFLRGNGLVTHNLRNAAVLGRAIANLRWEQFFGLRHDDKIDGARWMIDQGDAPGGYSTAFAREVLAKIRTDLDAFSGIEAKVLENHGYSIADHWLRKDFPAVVPGAAPGLPHPDFADEAVLRELLSDSHRRFLRGWHRRKRRLARWLPGSGR